MALIHIPCASSPKTQTIYQCLTCFTHRCDVQARREHDSFFAGDTPTHALDGCPRCGPYRRALRDSDGYTGAPPSPVHPEAVCKPIKDGDNDAYDVCTRTLDQAPCGECEPVGAVSHYCYSPVIESSECNLGFTHNKTVGYTYWAVMKDGSRVQLSAGQYEKRMK